jgi:hypothetical protein
MNIGRAFSFVFEDKNWLNKLVLPFFLLLIPIVNLSVTGWGLRIARNVLQGKPVTPLPELSFEQDFMIGLKFMVVSLVYSLPIIALSLGMAACNILGTLPVILSSRADSAMPALSIVNIFFQLGMSVILIPLSILYSFIMAAAAGHFAASDFDIAQGLNFKAVFGLIRSSFISYLLVCAGTMLGGLLSMAGFAVFCVGAFAVSAYLIPVYSYLWGDAYREARNKLSIEWPYAT